MQFGTKATLKGMLSFDSEDNGETVTVTREGTEYSVRVPALQFDAWRKGELIQNAMPELTLGQREFLISGMTPSEWDEMFNDGEEDVAEEVFEQRILPPRFNWPFG